MVFEMTVSINPADVSNNLKAASCAAHSLQCVIFLSFCTLLVSLVLTVVVSEGLRKKGKEGRRSWGFPPPTSEHPPPKFGHMVLHAPSFSNKSQLVWRGLLMMYNSYSIKDQTYFTSRNIFLDIVSIWFTTN